jgi:secernin
MCDTLVATPEATADGVTILGKNSDRDPNEAHHLLHVPAADHPPGSSVRCTYIAIPQAAHTHAILLAKPFWIWGAEMGANEHGLAIGNEAVFTRVPYQKEGALIGMDLLRLALERAANAAEAVTVITELLAAYGQGGNCGLQHKAFYHNSFLIADPRAAWVLETAGPHWAAKQVRGVYTISNGLTLGNEWDLASPDLVTHAVEKGWCRGRDDFDFARCYSDRLYTSFSACRRRRQRTAGLLTAQQGAITPTTMITTLRDHGEQAGPDWRPDRGLTGPTVCMHAAFGPIRFSQTAGSMVCHLQPRHPTYLVTATAAPCTSVFKPVWLDAPLPDTGPQPTDSYDPATLFWRHERLHRATLRDYPTRMRLYQAERDALEAQLVAGALARAADPPEERAAYAADCFAQAGEAEARWLERVSRVEVQSRPGRLYSLSWDRVSRQAGMPAS